MADCPVAKNGMPMPVLSDNDAFAIHRRAAGAAVVREAAAGAGAVVMSVKRLRIDRSESSKAGACHEESDNFFHNEGRDFAFFDESHAFVQRHHQTQTACAYSRLIHLFSSHTRIAAMK